MREYWVHVEYMKLLKDEVRNCYRREGVNHYENCRDLVQEYYKRTKAPSALRPAAPRTRPCPHPPAPLAPGEHVGTALARLGRSLTDAGCGPQCTSSSESGCVARVARSIIHRRHLGQPSSSKSRLRTAEWPSRAATALAVSPPPRPVPSPDGRRLFAPDFAPAPAPARPSPPRRRSSADTTSALSSRAALYSGRPTYLRTQTQPLVTDPKPWNLPRTF